MNQQPVACKACGALFILGPVRGTDACPHCGHVGSTVKHVSGTEKQKPWYGKVDLGEQ